jgi:hypothetical protein
MDGMVEDSLKMHFDLMLHQLAAQKFSALKPDADPATWDVWVELVELDSAIASTLIEMKDSGRRVYAPKPRTAHWRIVLTDETHWAGRWPVHRELLVAACNLLDEASSAGG